MHSSTILIVLGAAILAVNGVTTALMNDGIDKGTQETLQLLRSSSMKHETGEKRGILTAWWIAYKQRKREKSELAEKYYHILVHPETRNEMFKKLDAKKEALESAFEFIATNYQGLSDYTKSRIKEAYRAYRNKKPKSW